MVSATTQSQSKPAHNQLADRRVAFVGKLGGMNRREARRLVREHGGVPVERIEKDKADLIVIGADQLLPDDHEQLLTEELRSKAADGTIEVINETQWWQQLGMSDAENRQLYTPAMLAQLLDVSLTTIRRWHRRGLIVPAKQIHKLPYFDFQEVATARRLANLISEGASPDKIEQKLAKLTEYFPDLQRPMSQLSVIIEGKDVLLRRGEGLVEPGGQRRFSFDSINDEGKAEQSLKAIRFESEMPQSLEGLATAEQYRGFAFELEDEGRIDDAIEVYRSLLLGFGADAEVCFVLAELLYMNGQIQAARERYFMAIELDENYVEARASLGCVLLELGQPEMAVSTFEGALKYHPDYPDVHFHLARTLDDLTREDEAEVHWRQFLALSPDSPWASEARQRIGLADDSLPQS